MCAIRWKRLKISGLRCYNYSVSASHREFEICNWMAQRDALRKLTWCQVPNLEGLEETRSERVAMSLISQWPNIATIEVWTGGWWEKEEEIIFEKNGYCLVINLLLMPKEKEGSTIMLPSRGTERVSRHCSKYCQGINLVSSHRNPWIKALPLSASSLHRWEQLHNLPQITWLIG